MENGLACLATKLIALLAGEEITEKQAPRGVGGGEGCRRTLRQPGAKTAKTLINVFCAVFTVLECRAGGCPESYKHLSSPAVLCAKRAASSAREFFVGRICCQRDYPRERNAENVFRESGAMELYSESSLICMKHRARESNETAPDVPAGLQRLLPLIADCSYGNYSSDQSMLS